MCKGRVDGDGESGAVSLDPCRCECGKGRTAGRVDGEMEGG